LRLPIEFEGLVIAPSYTLSASDVQLGTYRPCSDTVLPSARLIVVAKGLAGLRSRVNSISLTGPFTSSLLQGVSFRDTLVVDVASVAPLTNGITTGTLRLNIGPCNTEFTIPLSVTMTERRWTAIAAQQVIGPLGAAQRGTTTITITNTGSDTIQLATLDGLTAPFQLVAPIPTLPAALAPAATLQLTVEYAFVGYGRTDDQALRIITGNPCADTFAVGLRGSTMPEGKITGVLIVAPLNVIGTAGTVVKVPLALESMASLDSANLKELTVYLSFDPAVVRPLATLSGLRGETSVVTEPTPGRASLRVTSTQPILPTQELATLTFQTYLAPVATTPLKIDSVVAGNVEIKGRDGSISVLGSCIISAELADLRNRADLRLVSVDASNIVLEVSTLTHDPSTVSVYTSTGERVAVPLAEQLAPGTYTLKLDVSAMANGTYMIVFEHGRHVRHCMVPLTR
jgi:hypothetical protein